jgi:Protein of Unknown function (DUF2604)
MKLVFIINGVDIEVELPKWSTLETAREIALSEAEIVGRPPEDFQVRDDYGVILPLDETLERFNFREGQRLFIMPYVGAGGALAA